MCYLLNSGVMFAAVDLYTQESYFGININKILKNNPFKTSLSSYINSEVLNGSLCQTHNSAELCLVLLVLQTGGLNPTPLQV